MMVVEAKRLALSAHQLITFLLYNLMKKLPSHGTPQEELHVADRRPPKKLFTSNLLLVKRVNYLFQS